MRSICSVLLVLHPCQHRRSKHYNRPLHTHLFREDDMPGTCRPSPAYTLGDGGHDPKDPKQTPTEGLSLPSQCPDDAFCRVCFPFDDKSAVSRAARLRKWWGVRMGDILFFLQVNALRARRGKASTGWKKKVLLHCIRSPLRSSTCLFGRLNDSMSSSSKTGPPDISTILQKQKEASVIKVSSMVR